MQKVINSLPQAPTLLLTPGQYCHDWTIQNQGSNDLVVGYDGTYTVSAAAGYLLKGGQTPPAQITKTFTGSKAPPIVVGMSTSSSLASSIVIITDDAGVSGSV